MCDEERQAAGAALRRMHTFLFFRQTHGVHYCSAMTFLSALSMSVVGSVLFVFARAPHAAWTTILVNPFLPDACMNMRLTMMNTKCEIYVAETSSNYLIDRSCVRLIFLFV